VKVYLDEDLSPSIAVLLRQRGVDATSAHEVGNSQLGDRAQFEYATREARAIVSGNVVDFLELARDAVATNTRHAGIILILSSFRGDEYQAIASAIVEELKPYPKGLDGVVLYIKCRQS
jgi:predicted nuclease of predicted toxin-antitoxin system